MSFSDVRGKTIAVVYIFEGENSQGFDHYDIWKSDVITGWLNAIESIYCVPYILDTRTFVHKAMNNTLPIIDYVINLNAGNEKLSSLGLIPSVCGFLGVPCIPCDTSAIIAGENKEIANAIAQATNVNVPRPLDKNSDNGIFRPLNYGSSRGVKRGRHPNIPGIYQEFIRGFDITTPIMYNPLTDSMELLPTVLYRSEQNSVNWFLGECEKASHSGFKRHFVHKIDTVLYEKYQELVKRVGIYTFCRIDARIHCETSETFYLLEQNGISFEDTYFIEINPMPTIRVGNNYYDSINNIMPENSFYKTWQIYLENFPNGNEIGFVLACAVMGLLKAKY